MSAEFLKIILEKLNILDELKVEVKNLSKIININTELIARLSKQVEQQGLNFAKFEHECILKLNALFDSFVSNTESHASFSKAIAALNLENFHQGIRISNLENLNNNTKILATN